MAKTGDIWKSPCGMMELRCGRWQDVLADVVECDAVITDPPYDQYTHKGAMTGSGDSFGVSFESLDDIPGAVQAMLPMTDKWVVVCCPLESLGLIQQRLNGNYVRGGIWDRVVNSPQKSGDRPAQGGEGIAILHSTRKSMKWNGGGHAGIWRHMVERGSKTHETQKPLSLMSELVQLFTDPGDLIVDPYAGSGTTLLAAAIEGRRCIGAEMDPKTFELAVKRLSRGYTPRMRMPPKPKPKQGALI